MNSSDYQDALKDIKPSKELNDKVVNQILNPKIMKKQSYKIRIAAICLILISLSGITIAASTWNLADIFKGYFKELSLSPKVPNQEESNNNSKNSSTTPPPWRPSTNNSSFLNTAGVIIESSDTNAGLKLTARGVVGDDRTIFIALEVETTDGQNFTKKQEDNLNSINFQTVHLKLDNDILGQYTGCTRIDDGSQKGKATFLIRDIIRTKTIEDIKNHHVTITLTNLLHTTHDIENIGMEGNLYDIFTKYEEPADSDYSFYSLRNIGEHTEEENKRIKEFFSQRRKGNLQGDELQKRTDELIESGLLSPLYLLPETSTKIPFSTKYPKLEITNMGIKNNVFTFNITMNDELSYNELLNKRLLLVNHRTGAIIPTTMDINRWEGNEGDPTGKLLSAHFIAFHAITSAEQLKDYYLAQGGYYSRDIINDGQWTLNFQLDYENTTRVYSPETKAVIAKFDGTINKIKISPLSITLIYQLEQTMTTEKRGLLQHQWVIDKNSIYLLMKDGTKINYLPSLDIEDNICTINAIFPYIIDLDQIDKIIIGEIVLPLE